MKQFAKGMIPCVAVVAILMAAFPNLTPALPMNEALEAARHGIKSAEVKDALGRGFNYFGNDLVSLMALQTKAAGGDPFIVSTVELLLKGGPGSMSQTHQFLDYWIGTMEIHLKAKYGEAQGQALWENLCKKFGSKRQWLQEHADFYNSMGNPPPPPGPQPYPDKDKDRRSLKNHLKADLFKMSTVVSRGPSLQDATTLKVAKRGEVDTPVIRIDPNLAARLKVATLPNALREAAVDRVMMVPLGGKNLKLASTPVPQPVPQPAVSHAKAQKALHSVGNFPLPTPRPVNTAAMGRR